MKRILSIAVLALTCPAAFAIDLHFQCPERYPSMPVDLAEVPKGWTAVAAQVMPGALLSGGGMIGASPKLQPPADLRGNDTPAKGGWEETRYPVSGESWAYCSYGQGGEIRLYRRVDGGGARECSVQFSPSKPLAALKVKVTCR
jgi:hypothetical protein